MDKLTQSELDDLVNKLLSIPLETPPNPISTMNSINLDELITSINNFKSVPSYNELLQSNNQLQSLLQTYTNTLSKALKYNREILHDPELDLILLEPTINTLYDKTTQLLNKYKEEP